MGLFSRKKEISCKNARKIYEKYFLENKRVPDDILLPLYNAMLKEKKEDEEYYGIMAYLNYRMGNIEKMNEYVSKIIEITSGNEDSGIWYLLFMPDVDLDTKLKVLKNMFDRKMTYPVLDVLVESLVSVGKKSEAIEYINVYLARYPKDRTAKKLAKKYSLLIST